jgi:phosphotransferase system HPr (HPr) family protein
MTSREITVENKLGLHARPSALLVKAATKYRSDFFIEKEGMKVNGKSIMGVMMLAAEYRSRLILVAEGVDEAYLMNEIVALFDTRFGEE